MKPVEPDDMKLRIIAALSRLQRRTSQDRWFSQSEIFEGVSGRYAAKREALVLMCSDGWLHVRHIEDSPETLRYRLRREYE